MSSSTPSIDQLFAGLTRALPELGIVLDHEGTFLDFIANDQTEGLLYDNPDQLIGKTLSEVFPQEIAVEFMSVIERAIDTNRPQEHEYRLSVKAGTRDFVGYVSPIPAEDDEPPHVIWISQDITELKSTRNRQQLYRTLIDEVTDLVLVHKPESRRIMNANKTACERLGYDFDELTDLHLSEIVAVEDAPEWVNEVIEGRETEDIGPVRTELERADGSTFPVEVMASYEEVDGEPYRIGIVRDITERVKLERERQLQHDLQVRTEELADIGGWEYIPATETLRWTTGTRRLYEVPDDFEPTVEESIEFYHPDDQPIIQEAVDRCLETGVPYSVELRLITETGQQRWVQTKGERLTENGQTKLRGVVRDISDQKLNEERLTVLNRILRHNIGNKLNVITGYTELLEENLQEGSEDLFDGIQSSADALLSLAEKARQFDQIAEHSDMSKPVDLGSLMAEEVSKSGDNHPDAEIESDLFSIAVPGNEETVRLLFSELIDNALKHNHRAEPTVKVTMARPSDDRVAVSVADDGPGLPDMEQAVLEGDEQTALSHSDGLGLWMVNWLTMDLNGGVRVVSDNDRGTVITVTLPTTASRRTD